MSDFYFTFGSAAQFPYGIGEFVEVINAPTEHAAREAFRAVYPDVHMDTLNCASVYRKREFDPIREEYYTDKAPVDSIDYTQLFKLRIGDNYTQLFKFRIGDRIKLHCDDNSIKSKYHGAIGTVTAIQPGTFTVTLANGQTVSGFNFQADKNYDIQEENAREETAENEM